MTKQTVNRSLTVGIILIIIGAVFLLENLNLLPYRILDPFFSWRGILLIIGTVIVTSNDNKTPGYVLLAIGGFFIITELMQNFFHVYWFEARDVFIPLLIIGLGVIILAKQGKSSPINISRFGATRSGDPEDNKDFLNQTAILGGGDVKVNTKSFRGGKITAFMGGGTYDLSNAELAEGSQEIDLFAMFGGASFIVPSDWNVRIQVTSLFGGFTDSRKFSGTAPSTDPDRELVIRGTVIFGGGDIKNFV